MSTTIQDYLKAIYKLQAGGGKVSTSALAERMGVTAPTVTSMISRLAEQGLLRHDRYRGVDLTEAGERLALEVIRHHRLWELFLRETLQIPLDQVHGEAERLEHALSDLLEDRMDELLGYPTHDPHGDPIPTKGGALSEDPHVTVGDLPVGGTSTVRRVPDSDPALLRYLASLGIIPGRPIRVLDRAPFGGTTMIDTGDSRHAIGDDLARRVLIAPCSLCPSRDAPGSGDPGDAEGGDGETA